MGIAVPSLWNRLSGTFDSPPGLTAHTIGPGGCVPLYSADSLATLKAQPDSLRLRGVPVADPRWHEPVTAPVTLQAKTAQTIVVTAARIEVMSTERLPVTGRVIDAEGCGGLMETRPFDVDLATHPVSLKPALTKAADGSVGRAPGFPFKVSAKDPEQLELRFPTVPGDVRFSITIDWVSEGEPGTVTLDNGGAGYRVMGLGTLPRHPPGALYGRVTPALSSQSATPTRD
ncbi:hypothetical protein [Streptomyces sp. NPDC097619]|uniref:hypothetical protein n=1 Tax=Streptomyces sp. NPDC097619 TaxID=3157228 RepID=UPI0033242D06